MLIDMRTILDCILNKVLNPRFIEVYTVRQASDEVWRTQQSKRDNNDKDEDNSRQANNVYNDKSSSKKSSQSSLNMKKIGWIRLDGNACRKKVILHSWKSSILILFSCVLFCFFNCAWTLTDFFFLFRLRIR